MSFFDELKRRNVFRVGIAYAISAWVLLQIVDLVLDNISAPDWVMQVFMLALAVGFPIAIIVAWAFEMTPDGIKKEKDVDRSNSITPQTGHKLDRSIILVLVIALTWFAWERFGSVPSATTKVASESTATTETTTDQTGVAKSIAVLPFVAMSSGPDDEYFADGLTEEILNSLAQLPELLVTARTSAFHFKGQDINVREIADALGVKHIVEGSVRRSGQRLRVTAQLIRAEDGFHLWSEKYDSTSEDSISVQEDIAEKIAQAMDVVMNDDKRESMRRAGLRDVEAFIAYQKGSEFYRRAHGEMDQVTGLQRANEYYEAVIDRVPEFMQAYVDHSDLYVHILNSDATGQPMTGVTEEMKATAFQNAASDLAAAAQYARTASERHNTEFDLVFLNGNWRGMNGRADKILNDEGCASSNWFESFAMVYGLAQQLKARISEYLACDPLLSATWFTMIRTQMWAGDLAGALETADQADQTAPGNWVNTAIITALVANGDFDEAEKTIATRFQDSDQARVYSIMVSAARNDQQKALELLAEMQQKAEKNGHQEFLVHAWTGDREFSNQMAAKIDQHPAGPLSLTLMVLWCACGAPWDLSATPNFAATLEEANLPWPPTSPINFPMKDW
ncbi:MAG: hypothetical protein GQ538_04325 [Xanthomonadales bacterium]|nr:hypothetical protein [Xanthomonadales bacterium]